MPKASAKKTKLALKHGVWLGIFLVLFAFITIALWMVDGGASKPAAIPQSNRQACLQKADSRDNACVASLERADSNRQQLRGLSGRDGLAPGTGMLFSFGRPASQCMWMKDMRFSIDMIWLNDKKEIIKVEPGVSPDTYPTSFCADETAYVIELNDGEAAKNGFVIGSKLKF